MNRPFFAVGGIEILYSFSTEVSEYIAHFLLSMYSMNHLLHVAFARIFGGNF